MATIAKSVEEKVDLENYLEKEFFYNIESNKTWKVQRLGEQLEANGIDFTIEELQMALQTLIQKGVLKISMPRNGRTVRDGRIPEVRRTFRVDVQYAIP